MKSAAGGIVGSVFRVYAPVTISNSVSLGAVKSPDYYAAGIVGSARNNNTDTKTITHTISNCYSTASVSGKTTAGILAFYSKTFKSVVNLTQDYAWDGQEVTAIVDTTDKFTMTSAKVAVDMNDQPLVTTLNAGTTTWDAAHCLLKTGPGATTPDTYTIPVIHEFTDEDLALLGCSRD